MDKDYKFIRGNTGANQRFHRGASQCRKGGGVEYLPEEKIEVEASYLDEIFDEAVESKERMMEKQRKPEEKQKEQRLMMHIRRVYCNV